MGTWDLDLRPQRQGPLLSTLTCLLPAQTGASRCRARPSVLLHLILVTPSHGVITPI